MSLKSFFAFTFKNLFAFCLVTMPARATQSVSIAPVAPRPLLSPAKSNPFAFGTSTPAPKPATAKIIPPSVPAPLPVPPLAPAITAPQLPDLQYIGQATGIKGQKTVLLQYQNQAVWVQQGSTFDGQFELAAIDSRDLVFKLVSSGVLHYFKIPPPPAFESR